jgi:D-cysteine desulfhydrase
MPPPDRIVVPLGTGGTAAGIALGLAIAGLDTPVVGVRVVPRIVANRARVQRLAARTTHLIERLTNDRLPGAAPLIVVHDYFGGAYGRSLPAGDAAAAGARQMGLVVDTTYSAKALAAAIGIAERERGTTLFWLSFDGRWLSGADIVARDSGS